MMRVAVTGTTGRVGAAIASYLEKSHQVIRLPRSIFDLAHAEQMQRTLAQLDCEVIINPAGITSLEACEENPKLAQRINAQAPAELAHFCHANRIKFIHFSTDYVFDGVTNELKTERHPTRPLSVYAASKLAGEQAVLAHHENIVLRVSWVFGPEKPSFADQVKRAALAGETLAAISDKFSIPTYTRDLAQWVTQLIQSDAQGLYHACQSGEPTSWHGMAQAVIESMVQSGQLNSHVKVEPLSLENAENFRAARPRFTAMDHSKLALTLGCTIRPWREALHDYLTNHRPPSYPR